MSSINVLGFHAGRGLSVNVKQNKKTKTEAGGIRIKKKIGGYFKGVTSNGGKKARKVLATGSGEEMFA